MVNILYHLKVNNIPYEVVKDGHIPRRAVITVEMVDRLIEVVKAKPIDYRRRDTIQRLKDYREGLAK